MFDHRHILEINMAKLKENDRGYQALAEVGQRLREENEVLIREIIYAENLLSKVTWKVGLNTKNPENIYLHGVYDRDLPEIMDLPTDGMHHYSISLVMGDEEVRFPGTPHERSWRPTLVHASFNDGEVSIHFDDPAYASQFLKDFEIKLTTDDIIKQAVKLETAATAIRYIADHAEGK